MDLEKTFALVGEMVLFHLKRARTISGLLYSWLDAKNEKDKLEIEKSIREEITKEFLQSIDKDTRREYLNCNLNINDLAYEAERRMGGWDITSWGADRYDYETGKIVETIPREYKKGFSLPERATYKAHIFSEKNENTLNVLATYMDRREEILTHDFKPAKGIPGRYIEHLIDYLGYRRIGDTREKRKAENQKKMG